MLFTVEEITRWLGITVLELFIFLVSVTMTIVLVMLHCTGDLPHSTSWLLIMSPMFVSDALNTYFCIIVLIRMYLYSMLRPASLRAMWSTAVIGLNFIFKFLLCRKLEDPGSLEFSAVLSPVFIILQLIMIRACHIKTTTTTFR
uniref:Transmembrane protein 203-like n=1 Tax=Hirondellea gigas TaxID=1518452 RepID=A0A6A7G1V4_9CRUS